MSEKIAFWLLWGDTEQQDYVEADWDPQAFCEECVEEFDRTGRLEDRPIEGAFRYVLPVALVEGAACRRHLESDPLVSVRP